MANSDFSLAILCGGQARRLGSDKGLFRPLGDESLIVRALRRFDGFARDLMVVVRDTEQASLYAQKIAVEAPDLVGRFRIVADTATGFNHPFQGSLRGIHTGLKFAQAPRLIALPVDQVALGKPHLADLLASPGLACFSTAARQIWSFPSVWSTELCSRIESLIEAGSFSVARALEDLRVKLVDGEAISRVLTTNINTTADAQDFFGTPLIDGFRRRMHYLRFSLIESCNMSCHYCLPDGFPEWYRHKARLSPEDISVLLGGFRRLGFRKVRFTGGEPTLHPGCLDSVRAASALGYEEICLTTNGTRLGDLSQWSKAGLTGLNISLDSIRPETFEKITKSPHFKTVLTAIEQACELGIDLKINTVTMRSENGPEIEQMIDWALGRPLTLRFIELMPTKLNQAFEQKERVHGYEIEPLLLARGLTDRIDPADKRGRTTRGPATIYRSMNHLGRIGLINPMSCNFCDSCNRLRLGAKGNVRLCLFAEEDIELPKQSPEAVEVFMRSLIGRKEERHHLEDGIVGNVSTFRTIGG